MLTLMPACRQALATLNTVTPSQLLAYTVPDTSGVDRSVFIDAFRSVTARMRSQEADKGNLTKVGCAHDGALADWSHAGGVDPVP